MQYSVYMYDKVGDLRSGKKVEAKSHKDAANIAKNNPTFWWHVIVKGKTTKRFDLALKEIKSNTIRFYKTKTQGNAPAILVMIANHAEMYPFPYVAERNKKFEELACLTKCTTSTFAASVKTEQERKDTIVYSEETDVSKNSSTSPRTLSGFAKNVTWQDVLTPKSIDKISGTDKSPDTAKTACSIGSTPSPSRQRQTLYGVVKIDPKEDKYVYPGINSNMMKLNGRTCKFEIVVTGGHKLYKTHGWFFKPEWVDTKHIYAQVLDLELGTKAKTPTNAKVVYHEGVKKLAGQTLKLSQCQCGCGCFFDPTGKDIYLSPEWVILVKKPEPSSKIDRAIEKLEAEIEAKIEAEMNGQYDN